MQSNRMLLKRIFIVAALLFVISILSAKHILTFAGWIITADDSAQGGGDYLVVLMGDTTSNRAQKALDLYKEGRAPKIIVAYEKESVNQNSFTTTSSGELHTRFFLDNSVPNDAIISLETCQNTSTIEEARCIGKELSLSTKQPPKIIIVTSWYHSGRAKWLFKKALGGTAEILSIPAPSLSGNYQNWWVYEKSFLDVFNEYLKWTYWRVNFILGRKPIT